MTIINTYEAKTHLSKLIDRVKKGEVIVIGRSGEPLVKMIPYTPEVKARKPGAWKGKVKISKDFDQLPKDILKSFSK